MFEVQAQYYKEETDKEEAEKGAQIMKKYLPVK